MTGMASTSELTRVVITLKCSKFSTMHKHPGSIYTYVPLQHLVPNAGSTSNKSPTSTLQFPFRSNRVFAPAAGHSSPQVHMPYADKTNSKSDTSTNASEFTSAMQSADTTLWSGAPPELSLLVPRQSAASAVDVLLPFTQALSEADQPLTPYRHPQSSIPDAQGTGGGGAGES